MSDEVGRDAIAAYRAHMRAVIDDKRRATEQMARMQDAYRALRTAILWLHGEYRDVPRSEFAADSWYRLARSGCVALRDILREEDQT